VNEDTGASDIAMNPDSPGTLIAAMYQRGAPSLATTEADPAPVCTSRRRRHHVEEVGERIAVGSGCEETAASADKDKVVDPEAVKEIGRIGVNFYRRTPTSYTR